MEPTLGKGFGQILGSIECSKELNKFIENSRIDKIDVYKKTGSIEIHASSDIYVPFKNLIEIEKIIGNVLSHQEVRIKMKFYEDKSIKEIFKSYKDDIIKIFNRNIPSSIGILHNAIYNFNGDNLEIKLECAGTALLIARRCDKALEKIILEMFGKVVKINFKDGEGICKVKHNLDPELEAAYGNSYNVPTFSMSQVSAFGNESSYVSNNGSSDFSDNNRINGITKGDSPYEIMKNTIGLDNSDKYSNTNIENTNGEDQQKELFAGRVNSLQMLESAKQKNATLIETSKSSNGKISAGVQRFEEVGDLSSRESVKKPKKGIVIHGKPIKDEIIKIQTISLDSGILAISGDVIKCETRELKKGDKFLIAFDITDYTSSVTVKLFAKTEKTKEIVERIKEGVTLIVRGEAQYDNYSRETTIMARDITVLPQKEKKNDEADKKRVELHLHTQMSSMDGVSSTKSLIKRAIEWGHSAIAITDHGVVQAFPEAMETAGKKIKVIYGVEAYLLNDSMPAVIIPGDMSIDGTFVVFDIETTGLNNVADRIIEIGAVKLVNNVEVDRFSRFVNPEIAIPEFITKLTGIDHEMVKDAPVAKEVLIEFMKFCEGSVLVAHNAEFDVGFIRTGLRRIDQKFDAPVLDTLVLSRKLLPELKKHKLDVVAKHFDVSLTNHHRAVDDSQATAKIMLKFMEMLREKGANNILDIDKILAGNEDYTKLKAHHAIIFVKNYVGLKNLYRIISESHLNYFYKKPRVPKKLLAQYREGLIIGSACEAGELYSAILHKNSDEEIEKIARYYDYLEIQPIGNNRFLVENGSVKDENELMDINRKIVELGKKLHKKVVATCDVHFMDPDDEVFRRILMAGQGFDDADKQAPLYFRTTQEMINEFMYLGEEDAKNVVIENTNDIADMIEHILPIPEGTFPPHIEGAKEEMEELAISTAKNIYGEVLPDVVQERLDKELNSIIKNGFSVMYIIAQKLVKKSLSDGYLVGSRGSVGSSFVANLIGITEVNSLPPHYICENCKYSEFVNDELISCGFDLPQKNCPNCANILKKDGYDIPFETFLGFDGDKEPDIDLNFSGEYQSLAHKYTEELFGQGFVFRAGTIGTIAEKTAFGFVKSYFDEKKIVKTNAEIGRLVKGCSGVKRTTGQHPGGVMIVPNTTDIYEFCPIQRPADDQSSSIITTHFDYHSISGRLLKLDILGHDDPTVIKMLEDLTGIDAKTIQIGESETMKLFSGTQVLGVSPEDINSEVGTFAVPEFGTKFVRQMLVDTRPTTFSELIRISGLSHGTDVWLNNAQELIRAKTANLLAVICTRDDIMLFLIQKGLNPKTAFKIMEDVRKGKGLKPEYIEAMKENNVPDWYIESCIKIKYMFPKAHAAAYVMMAFRIAWFKVHYPEAFYVAYFTVRADDFDAKIMARPQEMVRKAIWEYEQRSNAASLHGSKEKVEFTQKDKNVLTILEVVNEMLARGIKFLPIDLYESDALKFKMMPTGIRLPFSSLQGLGENAAKSIVEARNKGKFISIVDLRTRAKISKSVIEILREAGALQGMNESNQISMFEMM